MLSLVIPCYNEEDTISILYKAILEVLQKSKSAYEMIFIDDGSRDNTLSIIKEIALQDRNIIYISFSRNFGKEAAMYAGFCNARGDYVAVMDADMQDPPDLLLQMINILETQQYDCVATRRINRDGEPPMRSFFAKRFYKLINRIADVNIVDGARDFRMMRREMIDAIISMSEINRFSKGIFGWIGFKTYWISYENAERIAGESKWNFWSLFKYAIDGIINFSHVPLSIASWFGVLMTGFSFIMTIFIVARRLLFGDPVAGWASLACIIIFMGGFQLLCLGIMGQYISKTYIETKRRPHYIIAECNRKEVAKIR